MPVVLSKEEIIFEYETAVVGCQYYYQSNNVEPGNDLVIFREPTNRHDKNAIQVLYRNHCVGYLNRLIAAEICGYLDGHIIYMEAVCIHRRSVYEIGIKIKGYSVLKI
jgi:hypothetical protein